MDMDKMMDTSSAVTLNIEDLESECAGTEINLEINRFRCQKLLQKKTIKEEEERCIQEAVSTNLHMENLVDELVIHMKETYAILKFVVSKVIEAMMYENMKLRYLIFDEDELFKWRDECKKGMPIDYNFKFCKGTLSDFEGSKGALGELSPWNDSFDEPVETSSRSYDVIRYKAEAIPRSWPADGDTNKVYTYARLIALADYKYYFLYRLTSLNLHLLGDMIDLEVFQPFKKNECQYCRKTLTSLCKINEEVSEFWEFAENEWNNGINQSQTISEYKEMVEELGYGDACKESVDLWTSWGRSEKKMVLRARIKLYLNIMPCAIFSLILFKLRFWYCYSFLEKIILIVFPKIPLETLRFFLLIFFNIALLTHFYTGFPLLLQLLF